MIFTCQYTGQWQVCGFKVRRRVDPDLRPMIELPRSAKDILVLMIALSLNWVRQSVVLYSLPLNLCLCFCLGLDPMWI